MKLKTFLAATATTVLMAGSASAITLDFSAASAGGSVNGIIDSPNSAEFTIAGNAPFTGFQIFSSTADTTITLEDYDPDGIDGATSGLVIIDLVEGEVLNPVQPTDFTNIFNFIESQTSGACGSLCDLAGVTLGGQLVGVPDEGLTFSGLSAGTYLVAIQENGDPEYVAAQFDVSQVPLPAAGWMLLAGVGGLAAMKRRRRNA